MTITVMKYFGMNMTRPLASNRSVKLSYLTFPGYSQCQDIYSPRCIQGLSAPPLDLILAPQAQESYHQTGASRSEPDF